MTRLLFIIALLLVWAQPVAAQEAQAVGTVETVGTPENPALCNVSTANNESVWPGNVLILTGGGQSISVPGVEDVANTVKTIEILSHGLVAGSVVLAPGNQTSLEFSVACTVIETTTTTEEEVTTSSEPDEPTTTTRPDEPTTTTQPPPPPTVTTTPPPDSDCPDDGLACTGTETSVLVAAGAGLLVAGLVLTSPIVWARRR